MSPSGTETLLTERFGPDDAGNRLSAGAGNVLAHRVRGAVLAYLVGVGILESRALTDHGIRTTDLSRSHTVISVQLADSRGLIVKRARPRAGEQIGSLGREISLYRLAADHPQVVGALPEIIHIDEARQIIVLETVIPGQTLHAFAYRRRQGSREHALRLAAVLGTVHRTAFDGLRSSLPREEPWVLGILTPGRWRPEVADQLLAHGAVRRKLRSHFKDLVDLLRPSCLIHGDLKWDNCLIDRKTGIRIIDWEMAAIGDPAWDVAGILQEQELLALHGKRASSPDETDRRAGRLWMQSFLRAYIETADPYDGELFVDRAARLTGARLVQTALELAAMGKQTGGMARGVLDRGLAILSEPDQVLGASVISR